MIPVPIIGTSSFVSRPWGRMRPVLVLGMMDDDDRDYKNRGAVNTMVINLIFVSVWALVVVSAAYLIL
jgi:hypothetical protein